MKQICIKCDGTIKNTGKPVGLKAFGYDAALILVPLLAADGSRNFLDLSAPDMNVELLSKLNEPDSTKRWYKIDDVQSVSSEQADSDFETSGTKERFKVLDGIKNYNFDIWNISHEYYRQVERACVEFGIIRIDNCGNMLGETNDAETEFYPREVNTGSYDSKYMDPVAGTSAAKIHIDFDFDITTSDGNQSILSFDEFSDFNPLKLSSMLDVDLKLVSVDSATEITVQANLIFGHIGDRTPVLGLENSPTDFDIRVKSTGITVGPTTGVAKTGTPGEYKLTNSNMSTAVDYVADFFKAATDAKIRGLESNVVEFTTP